MTDLQIKLKLIFRPFMAISLAFIIIYTFFNWYIAQCCNWFKWDEILPDVIIPIILSFVPMMIWLRPRIKLLVFDNKKVKHPVSGYIMMAAFASAAPTVAAQFYIASATGKLTQMPTIDKINDKPLTKYYSLKHYFVSKRLAKNYSSQSVSSKGQRLTWYNYMACPIFADTVTYNVKLPGMNNWGLLDTAAIFKHYPADRNALIIIDGERVGKAALTQIEVATVSKFYFVSAPRATALYGAGAGNGALVITRAKPVTVTPKAWLCYSDSKEVSNKLSQVEKDTLRRQFYTDSYLRFKKSDLDNFDYLDRMGYSAFRGNFVKAINYPALISEDPVIFEPCYGSFENRSGYKLHLTIGLFALGALIFFLMLLRPPVDRAGASAYLPLYL